MLLTLSRLNLHRDNFSFHMVVDCGGISHADVVVRLAWPYFE